MSKYIEVVPNRWKLKIGSHGDYELVKWDEGGRLIMVGSKRGSISEPKWRELESFYPNIPQAVRAIATKDLEDGIEDTISLAFYIDKLGNLLRKYSS